MGGKGGWDKRKRQFLLYHDWRKGRRTQFWVRGSWKKRRKGPVRDMIRGGLLIVSMLVVGFFRGEGGSWRSRGGKGGRGDYWWW